MLMANNILEFDADTASALRKQINQRHMKNGVRIIDPLFTYIDEMVIISADVVIYPGTILEGSCKIAAGAVLGPNTYMVNTVVGKNTHIQYSVLKDAYVGEHTDVGPFAYLRPGANVGNNCRVGDFVEVKNSKLGNETKVSHLAYIGDADVGANVNWGCGAITANYDGKKKHKTVVHDNAFVGCNSNLIAPVTIGEGALVAAGSTITDEVPSDALAIARQRQINKSRKRTNI